MRTAITLLLALALAIVPAGVAGAQSGGETNSEVRTTDESATIEYRRSIDGANFTERIEFGTNTTTFTVSFQRTNETGAQVNELDAQLHEIAEYEDENENDRYDPDEPVASSYRLSEDSEDVLGGPENGTVHWDDVRASETRSDDGEPGKVVHARGRLVGSGSALGPVGEVVDEAPNQTDREQPTFHVRMYVFDRPTTVNGTQVDPGEVKVSLETRDYPYAENGTQLALGLEARSDLGLENASRADEGVQVGDNIEDVDVDLLYTWNSTAEVDGRSQPVGTTRLDAGDDRNASGDDRAGNDTERLYAVSYERGSEVVHDPLTGARLSGAAGALDRARDRASEVPGWTLATALSTLAVATALIRRRG